MSDPTPTTLLGHLTDRRGAHEAYAIDVDGEPLLTHLAGQYVLLADADRVDGEGPVWDESTGEWVSAAGGGGGGVTLEQVQDDLGNTSLIAGTGITKTYDDGAGTITLDADAASATAQGVVELATIAETDTGTDDTRAVTPAGLAGSALQTKVDGITEGATDDTTVDTLLTRLSASGLGVVNHGATAGTARATGYAYIQWVGSVDPTNAIDGDTWIDTA